MKKINEIKKGLNERHGEGRKKKEGIKNKTKKESKKSNGVWWRKEESRNGKKKETWK